MRLNRFTKIAAVILISYCSTQAAIAQDETAATSTSDSLLAQIAQYTSETAQYTNVMMQVINTLPTYLNNIGQMVIAWMTPDNSTTTSTMQQNFTALGNLIIQDLNQQLNQDSLNANLLGPKVTPQNMPYANDLLYSSILGQLYFSPDPRNPPGKKATQNPAYNYIRNAAGLNLFHMQPLTSWQGSTIDQLRYQGYYNTIMAVESYNAFILSHQLADGTQFNTMQQTLITQATDPKNWFAQVASENIGFVLRQILLYESQTFVLMTQLVQTQRQMVTAQAMTNAALIADDQLNEGLLATNAQTLSAKP